MTLRVLLADDEPSVLSALRLLLEQETDVQVVGEVTDADSLQKWLSGNDTDIVLLDWHLPGNSASELIKVIHGKSSSIQVVVLDSSPQTRREAIANGADNFVSKVDPSEQLLAVLEATRRILGPLKTAPEPRSYHAGRDMNFGEFHTVRVGAGLRVYIYYGRVHRVIVGDSDIDRVKFERNGEVLNVNRRGLDWLLNFQGHPEATIEMPLLDNLVISGVSQCNLKGLHSDRPLSVDISGASTLDLDDMAAGESLFKVSGASHIAGSLSTGNIDIRVSGASWTVLAGSTRALHLVVQGASHAELEGFQAGSIKAEIHGASHGTVNTAGRLDAQVNGASHLYWLGHPVMGDIDISGASHIQKR